MNSLDHTVVCDDYPVFHYVDMVWGGLSIGCSNNLQRLQNMAAHVIQRRATTVEAFKMLGWFELETQRKAHKCILVFKCLNDLVPPYLSNYFIRNSTIHTHKIRQRNDIHLPKPKVTLGKKHLYFQLWFFLMIYP